MSITCEDNTSPGAGELTIDQSGMWLYHTSMNWKKRGINAYKSEKGKGSGHDLDFDGERDVPIVSHTADKLTGRKKKKKETETGPSERGASAG